MNNTSTTAMLFPIGLSVLTTLARQAGRNATRLRFGTALMLILAWASSIGGITTPVGSSPNLIALGQLQELAGVRVPFFHWMAVATPIAVAMIAFLLLYFRWALPPDLPPAADAGDRIRAERASLPLMSRAEKNVLFAFSVTVSLWVLPGLLAVALGPEAPLAVRVQRLLPEPVSALLGASLLFVLPVEWKARRMTIEVARRRPHRLGHVDALRRRPRARRRDVPHGPRRVDGRSARRVDRQRLADRTHVSLLLDRDRADRDHLQHRDRHDARAARDRVRAGRRREPDPARDGDRLRRRHGLHAARLDPAQRRSSTAPGAVPITAMARHGFVVDLASAAIIPVGVLVGCRWVGLA